MVWKRWLPASGIVFVALIILSTVVFGGSTPSEGASAAKISSFYNDNETRQLISSFVLAAAAPFAVLFAASLAAAHWQRDRSPVWEIVLVAGGAVAAAAVAATAFIHFALTDAANKDIGGDGIRALNTLDASSWVLFNPAFGVMMLGVAGVLLARATSPRWMAWVALVIGIALFIPFADFFALLLMGLWLIIESVIMVRATQEARPATATSAA